MNTSANIRILFEIDEYNNESDIEYVGKIISICEEMGNIPLISSNNSALKGDMIFHYNNPSELDNLCLENKINILFRIVSNEHINNRPLSNFITNCMLYTTDDVNNYIPKRGDINLFQKDIIDIGQYIEENMIGSFHKISKVHGYKLSSTNFLVLFSGNNTPPVIPVLYIEEKLSNKTTSIPVDNKVCKEKSGGVLSKNVKRRVKPLCNWTDFNGFVSDWNKASKGSNDWDNIVLTNDEADYYVVINAPVTADYFDPKKTIVFRMEPYIETDPNYSNWLVGDRQRENFMYFMDHKYFRNNTEWWTPSTPIRDETIHKTEDCISAVVSSLYNMEGHKLRIDFIDYFQKNCNIRIDVYGRENKFNLQNYKGPLPQRAKDLGLYPYKYHLAVENSDIDNYFTEKLYDGIMGECLVFYWGCSNVEDYIDPRAFIRLDLKDKDGSIKKIQEAIRNDEWSKRIDIIKREKRRILNNLNFFPRVQSLISIKEDIKCVSIGPPQFIPGIDHDNVIINKDINISLLGELFNNHKHGNIRKNEIYRLLAHTDIWSRVIEEDKVYLVIDGRAGVHFLDHLCTFLSDVNNREWDILFLNWKEDVRGRGDNISTDVEVYIEDLIRNPLGISAGYILSPSGAKKLLDIYDKYGYIGTIDEFLAYSHRITAFKSYIAWTDLLVNSSGIGFEKDDEVFYIFREYENNLSNESIPFRLPPVDNKYKTTLVSSSPIILE